MSQFFIWQSQRINNLALSEYIGLKATLKILEDRQYICDLCLRKYDGRADKEKLLGNYRKLQGCFGDNRAQLFVYDDLSFYTCPGNIFDSSTLWIMEAYKQYQLGTLPFEGSVTEQPAKIMECFSVIDDFNNKRLEEQRRKSELGQRRRV